MLHIVFFLTYAVEFFSRNSICVVILYICMFILISLEGCFLVLFAKGAVFFSLPQLSFLQNSSLQICEQMKDAGLVH